MKLTDLIGVYVNDTPEVAAQAELIKTRSDLLKYQTVIENYTAQASACEQRIVRLQAFLEQANKGEAK